MLKSLFILLAAIFMLCSCSGADIAREQAPAPVHAAEVRRGDMSRELEAVGNVRASASVAITPRVDGEIIAVNFTEGAEVLAGESILEIDPRPYAAILAEKRANLSKSRAQLQKAQQDRMRYGKLVQDGYVSRQAYDQTVTDAAALSATVLADEAAMRHAELDLSFCSIIAPISGRIGELKMHKGNMVKNNDSGAVCTIDTISPCYVEFSVPEAHLTAILDHLSSSKLKVIATPIGGRPEAGTLDLVDNSVDTRTGTIRLRATFANESKRLWPGQFVVIKLPLDKLENVLLVPTRAIQLGRDESFVYVISDDNHAEYRKVRKLLDQGQLSAVEGELRPGERVVTEGQVRLTPGAPVNVLK